MKKNVEASLIRQAAVKDLNINASHVHLTGKMINRGECRMALLRAYLFTLGIKASNLKSIVSDIQATRNEKQDTLHVVRGAATGEFLLHFGCEDAVTDGGKAFLLIDIKPVLSCVERLYA